MDKPQSFKGRIVTVSEYLELLNEYIKPLDFSIIGEVSSVTDRSGSAVFFTVSDEEEQAVMNCVIWRGIYRGLGFKLEVGMKIKMSGYPNIYKQRGSLSYVVQSIIPTGGGALLKAFEELKAKLDKEGFFEPKRKRLLPRYITKIGLITAKQSDAIKDFETHLGNFGTTVYVHDVRVEGFSAIENIVGAVKTFNESMLGLEVLVITRGGGSLESLQAFNSEAVARAVYSSRIPVLSAIGHEKDITISDLIADIRGSTPTDAGKILSQDWRESEDKIGILRKQMLTAYKTELTKQRNYIEYQIEKIIDKFKRLILEKRNYLQNSSSNLYLYFQNIFRKFYDLSKNLESNFDKFSNKLMENQHKIQTLQKVFMRECEYSIKNNKARLKQIVKLLKSNDPNQKLKQGYTLTRDMKGKMIKSVKELNTNDILSTYFIDGEAKSKVTAISEKGN